MTADVLIIEDEHELADLIALYLNKEGINTVICESAEEAWQKLRAKKFDLITLDINLPGMDGFEFLQDFCKNYTVPVIIVSAREADEDIIMGLGIGADEFVTKPFTPKVLAARIRAILRRSKLKAKVRQIICFAEFKIDLDGFILTKAGKRVSLSVKEFEILSYLVQHKGKTFSPEELYERVWGNRYGDITTVGVYIQRLRKKIENNPKAPVIIETIHGMGYRFNPHTIKEE